jgi:hypothetical protein
MASRELHDQGLRWQPVDGRSPEKAMNTLLTIHPRRVAYRRIVE